MPRKAGFTLIELLVVVAIIAILAAMLAPALRGARERTKGVACMSNLKQLAIGVKLYLNDNRDTYPPRVAETVTPLVTQRTWHSKILPYLNQNAVALCTKNLAYRPTDPYVAHYGVTAPIPFCYQVEWGYTPMTAPEVTQPERRMLIYDCGTYTFTKGAEASGGIGWTTYLPGWSGNVGPNSYLDAYQQDLFSARHGAVNNAVFVDGHGESLTPAQMVSRTAWDP
jgi:prepilin-type N-terminal cleavage/methylation domain-containing protein/prepilin-type processing-associated H-X9-DG protein